MSYDPAASALVALIGASVPQWRKYTKTYTQLSAAALTNDVELFSLPAKGVIQAVVIKHSTAFAGGLIATYTVSVGIVGNLVKYAAAFNVFQAAGSGVSSPSAIMGMESSSGATSIRLAAISTVGNLNAATAGSVDVWVLWGVLP